MNLTGIQLRLLGRIDVASANIRAHLETCSTCTIASRRGVCAHCPTGRELFSVLGRMWPEIKTSGLSIDDLRMRRVLLAAAN